ncbi:phage holin family protein [Pseudomonas citronellolis]|uniref:phage holin family protein n=1 Tax=Pseudomonas citronellolis TaxID=53408 RepID=UPI002111312C|nr:phage holin family protein [Pseudomonas citronellolis]UUC52103.1 phage holin family protein [Pseudomonas citronellolis]
MSDATDAPQHHGPSVRSFGAALLGLLHGHVELFGLELQEQKSRTLALLLFAGLALLFALLLILGLSLLVLVLFWDSDRLAAVLGLCAFYALGGGLCAWRLYQLVDDDSSPFSATLEELARDREQLLP